VKVIARCTFSSAGLQAAKLGAAAVVAEQVVAREFTQVLEKSLGSEEQRAKSEER
jgi:hypothetical protein